MNKLEERLKIIDLYEKYSSFLTQTQKQAIHLHYIEDLSFSEIGEIVATTRSAVNDAIKKGVKKLFDISIKMND